MFCPDPAEYEEGTPIPSDVLLWRLGRLYEAWRAGTFRVPPERWDAGYADLQDAGNFDPPHCIELECDDGDGDRHYHLSTGEVLVFAPVWAPLCFPFSLCTIEEWVVYSELVEEFEQRLLCKGKR